MDAAGLCRVLIGAKSFFCFRSKLNLFFKAMPHTAHRRPLLSAARSSSSRRHLARCSAVHVESSDTMRSRKALCQAPAESPETGNTYRVYISQKRKLKKLRWRENKAPRRIQQAAQKQRYGYVGIQARLISTNPKSMEEACKYGLPRGTCFVARRLKLVAVAGRL